MSNGQIVERYVRAHVEADWAAVGELTDPNVVVTYPQSGETIRGSDNYTTMLSNYPGGLDTSDLIVTETHQPKESVHVQATPFGLPTITVSGAGNTFFFEGVAKYPDASVYNIAGVIELRDGLVVKETWYFAAPFDAPEWRAAYVDQ
jgi:hypothetical protein